MSGEVTHAPLGAGSEGVAAVDTTEATRELAAEFARALATGDRESIESLLAESVAATVPGLGPAAGRHDGRADVLDALLLAGRPDASIDAVEVTELLADGRRALVVVAQGGTLAGRTIAWETAFHLQTDGERILGVTEYAGDQYVADEMVAGPPEGRESDGRRWSRWRGRVRRGRR